MNKPSANHQRWKKFDSRSGHGTLLTCKETEKYDFNSIFHARIKMSVVPIYYDIQIEQTGELILRTNNKSCALRIFDYISRKFPNHQHKISLGAERNILKWRLRSWYIILKRTYLFLTFLFLFACFMLLFVSYGVYSDYSKHEWRKSSVLVENISALNEIAYVRIVDSKEKEQELKCHIIDSDVPELQTRAIEKDKFDAYLSSENQPELRLKSPRFYVLFLCLALCSLLISTICCRKFLKSYEKE